MSALRITAIAPTAGQESRWQDANAKLCIRDLTAAAPQRPACLVMAIHYWLMALFVRRVTGVLTSNYGGGSVITAEQRKIRRKRRRM